MARAYAGAAGTHMVLGLLSMAAGVTWICLLYFYQPLFVSKNGTMVSFLDGAPAWLPVLLAPKIYCGCWVRLLFVVIAIGIAYTQPLQYFYVIFI